jgi:hypothetical protein
MEATDQEFKHCDMLVKGRVDSVGLLQFTRALEAILTRVAIRSSSTCPS